MADKKDIEKKKKKDKGVKFDPSKYIETEPSLDEARAETVVITFGRFSPPTIGHEKLINKIQSVAKSRNADAAVYASHTQDKKKNPLSYNDKIRYLQKAFGKIIKSSNARTIIHVAKELDDNYDNLVVVVGADRVKEFDTLLQKYNGKEYTYKNIEVISAGDRDPDAEDVTGMSASKLRALAAQGDFEMFRKGVPTKLKSTAQKLYDDIRKGMGVNEETLDEVLSISQRRARGRMMKRYAKRNARKRKISMRRKASGEKLQKRALKKARNIVKAKMSGGKNYNDLAVSQKVAIDKRVEKKKSLISKIAKRQLKDVRKAEIERVKKMRSSKKEEYDINEQFELFMEAKKIENDPCWDGYEMIGKKKKNGKEVPNCVPKESVDPDDVFMKDQGGSGNSAANGTVKKIKNKNVSGDFWWAKNKSGTMKIFDNEKKAKRFASKMDEQFDLDEMKMVPKKRFHQLLKKNGKPLIDRRFKMFKNPKTSRDEYVNDAMKLKEMIEESFKDDPTNREEGTGSLDNIYRDDTPGQEMKESSSVWKTKRGKWANKYRSGFSSETAAQDHYEKQYKRDKNTKVKLSDLKPVEESQYYNSNIPGEYDQIEKGERVVFVYHSNDMAEDDTYEKEGTVIGSGVSHLRVRDDDGKLHLVRHDEAIVTEDIEEPLFTLDEAFGLRFMRKESMMNKVVDKIHKHVSKGKHLDDIVIELLRLTGLDINSRDIIKAYIKKHGDPRKKPPVSPSRERALRKKYLGA